MLRLKQSSDETLIAIFLELIDTAKFPRTILGFDVLGIARQELFKLPEDTKRNLLMRFGRIIDRWRTTNG